MRFDSLVRSAGMGLVVAVVAVIITYLIADAVSGPLLVTAPGGDGPEEAPLGGAIFGTVIGAVVGTGLAFVAARTSRSKELFVGICALVLVLYGLYAFSAAEESATAFWLNLMHIVAALPIVGALTRWLQLQRSGT